MMKVPRIATTTLSSLTSRVGIVKISDTRKYGKDGREDLIGMHAPKERVRRLDKRDEE
jgi:hypothetical protein